MLQDNYLSPEVAITALVQCNGNRALAAERLSRSLNTTITPSDITAVITSDPLGSDSLSAQLRLGALLQTYDLLSELLVSLKATLGDLTPKELATATSNILNVFNSLTSSPNTALTSNVNITEVVLKMLPPDARNAILELLPSTTSDPTSKPSNGYNHGQ